MRRRTGVAELQGLIRDIQVGFSTFHALTLTPEGVSLSQFAVLVCLAQRRPRKMSEVARAIHVSLPAVTHLVDRLEHRHLIRRQAHPTDRRVSLLDLTPRGIKVVGKTQGRTLRILMRAFRRHGPSEQHVIFDFMEALRAGILGAVREVDRGS